MLLQVWIVFWTTNSKTSGLEKEMVLFSSLFFIFFISFVINTSPLLNSIKFLYSISRPFILISFVSINRINIFKVVKNIVFLSRLFIIINLPKIVFKIIKIGPLIFQDFGGLDSANAFFPFGDSDTLTLLYSIVLIDDFYKHYFLEKKRFVLIFLESLLLITTMNVKYIVVLIGALGLVSIIKKKINVRKLVMIFLLVLIPILFIFPKLYSNRFVSIGFSPIFSISAMILSGNVDEHNLLFGTGPGTFTSKIALDSNSPLTKKYGLQRMKTYWNEYSKRGQATGTLTRMHSSVLTLFGETGLLGLLISFSILIKIIILMLRNLVHSPTFLFGYVFGCLSLIALVI